jgi:RHS repeat-associated protein
VIPDTGTVPLYRVLCYSDSAGSCTGWGLSAEANGSPVAYLSQTAPDPQSQNSPFVQSGGLLYQGLDGAPSAYVWTNAPTIPRKDHAYATDGSVPTGYTAEEAVAYLRQQASSGTAPLTRYFNAATESHYYSTMADAPSGYTAEAVLGHVDTSQAPGLFPLARHYSAATNDYLLTTSTTPPAGYTYQATLGYVRLQSSPLYVWTNPQAPPLMDHIYTTDGSIPLDYSNEGVVAYLRQSGDPGTLALTRYLNAATGSHYYSTTADAPSGYSAEAVLGYLDPSQGPGLFPLVRHYHAATNDYLLSTSTTPPAGYTYQATLGYVRLQYSPPRYFWSNPQAPPRTDHFYTTDGTIPPEYTTEGIMGYLRQYPGLGTAPLTRYFDSATGSHYYSTTADAPSGYTAQAALGHLEEEAGADLVPLARHYNGATKDYRLTTSTTPPAGYTYQATLGYTRLQGSPQPRFVTFAYDTGTNGKGRRIAMTDLTGSESYAYDALGRTISVTRTTDGVAYTSQTTYTLLGQPATITYPDGEVVTYTYDAGKIASVVGATTYVSNMAYDAAGQITQVTYGNGTVTTHTYSPTTLRLTGLVSSGSGGSLQNLAYAYDNVGNVTAITDNRDAANNQSFTYDQLDRLTSATGPYGSQVYVYNAIGNVIYKEGVTYSYGATAQTCNRLMPHAVTGTTDGKTYAYDCNGNMVSDGERTLAWDADNKPVSISRVGVGTTEFGYSGDGARVKKVGPSRTIRYVGGFEDHVTDSVQVKHISAGSLPVATRVVGGINPGIYFLHGDHLGSLNVLTNSQGAEVQRLSYQPFGETHSNTGSVDFYQHRYTGQEQDPETGLYFYNARYYNPVLGRFISPDSIVPEPGNPQSLNRYSYVENNPVNRIDPSGHFSFGRFFKTVAKVAIQVGMVVASIAATLTGNVWAVPIIAAAGSASLTALEGGNIKQIALSAGVGAAAGTVALGVGSAVNSVMSPLISSSLSSTLSPAVTSAIASAPGHIVGAAAGGFVQGVGSGIAMGTSWQETVRFGYQRAAFAAGTTAIAEAAYASYMYSTDYAPDLRSGIPENPDGTYKANEMGAPQNPRTLAVGGNETLTGYWWKDWYKQGHLVGKLGKIPFLNALGVLHDTWVTYNSGATFSLLSQGTYLPALVVTEAAFLAGPVTSVVLTQETHKRCCD